MSYQISPTPHATLSSSLTQTPASTTLAYPMIFENTNDIEGLYRQTGSFTVNNSGGANCTITRASHKLSIGAAVVFSGLTGATGITAGAVYYVATDNFTTGTFELAATFSSASPAATVKTSASGSGTVTCVSRLYFPESGDFKLTLSAIIGTSTNTDATYDIWFSKGNITDNLSGTNLDRSNTQVLMVVSGQRVVLANSIIVDVLKGDFIRLDMRSGSANNLSLVYIAPGTNPTRPSTPSAILTAHKTGR